VKQVGVYEAKTRLAKLLDEVEKGETIVITRYGRPVAKLAPLTPPGPSVDETIDAILEFRKGRRLEGITTRELINEGRRI
jgi:prevent-host-death family protein